MVRVKTVRKVRGILKSVSVATTIQLTFWLEVIALETIDLTNVRETVIPREVKRQGRERGKLIPRKTL